MEVSFPKDINNILLPTHKHLATSEYMLHNIHAGTILPKDDLTLEGP